MLRDNSSTVNWRAGKTSEQALNNGIAKRVMNPVCDFAKARILPIIGAVTRDDEIPKSFSIDACLENSSIRIVAHCAAQSWPRALFEGVSVGRLER